MECAKEDPCVARGYVADAACLVGPRGARLNELRFAHPRCTIQLTNGQRRELLVRGPRSAVEAALSEALNEEITEESQSS